MSNQTQKASTKGSRDIVQLYVVQFVYTGDDSEDFLEFAFMSEQKAHLILARLEKLQENDHIDRVYVGPVQNYTSSEHDILQSISDVEAQFDDTEVR